VTPEGKGLFGQVALVRRTNPAGLRHELTASLAAQPVFMAGFAHRVRERRGHGGNRNEKAGTGFSV
jgi:hypothetical protein